MKLKWRFGLLLITILCIAYTILSSDVRVLNVINLSMSLTTNVKRNYLNMADKRGHIKAYTTSDDADAAHEGKQVELGSEIRQRKRQGVLIRSCSALEFEESPNTGRNLTSDQLALLRHTYVIDNLKLLYCYVPKVSCTNWKRLFLVSNGYFPSVDTIKNAHVEADRAFRKLGQLPVDEANRRLTTHTHFLFVRNPFSRLLSAYREKIESRNPAECFFSKFITRWLQKNDRAYLSGRNASQGYTFPEFIRYAIARRVDNEHWNDQYQLCSPCAVKYHFIGKYETLRDDAAYLLRTYANDSSLAFPAPQKRPTHSSDDAIMRQYYRQVPTSDIRALVDCLYTDMRLFGYSIPKSVWRRGLNLSAKYSHLSDIG